MQASPCPLKASNYKSLSTPPPRSSSQSQETSAAALSYKSLTMPLSSTHSPQRHTSVLAKQTKMKTPHLLVLLLAIMAHAGSAFPSDRKQGREKHASWDDVNVVAHGLLQLGQGLKEHVDKTKAQMRDVSGKLKAFNSTVAELQRRQQEQGRALEARGEEMEERVKAAAQLAVEAKEKVEEVRKENDDIHSRMGRLEEKVEEVLAEPALDGNDSDHSGVLLLQVRGTAEKEASEAAVAAVTMLTFLLFPEAAGSSEQTHRPSGGEDQAAARQTGEAEPAPASAAEQGESRLKRSNNDAASLPAAT